MQPTLAELLAADPYIQFGSGTMETYRKQAEHRRRARLGLPTQNQMAQPIKALAAQNRRANAAFRAQSRGRNKFDRYAMRAEAKAQRQAKRQAWKNRNKQFK